MDERCDNVRAIRDQRFLYIRNYMPYAPWGQHLNYLWTMRATQAWEQHHREGKTDAITGRFLRHQADGGTLRHRGRPGQREQPDRRSEVREGSRPSEQGTRSMAAGAFRLRVCFPKAKSSSESEESGKTIYEMVRDPVALRPEGVSSTLRPWHWSRIPPTCRRSTRT